MKFVMKGVLENHGKREKYQAIPVNRSSFDGVQLIPIIKRVYPNIIIERQSRVLGFTIDLKLTMERERLLIESKLREDK